MREEVKTYVDLVLERTTPAGGHDWENFQQNEKYLVK